VPVTGPAGVIPATSFLIHVKAVPSVALAGLYTTALLLHISGMVSGLLSDGVGLTVIVNDLDGPWQSTEPLLNVGVTVIKALTGAVPGFEGVKEIVFPVPEATRFMEVLLLVHE
jgi:hypothetical protein